MLGQSPSIFYLTVTQISIEIGRIVMYIYNMIELSPGVEFMKASRLISVLLSLIILTVSLCSCTTEKIDIPETSTMEYVQNFGIGINLGNTFESCGDWIHGDEVKDYETAWGSPVITERIIKGYAEAGFGVVRVPVAWSNMMDEDYTIAQEYLDRVHEVTEWITDAGMCAIVNIHWDGGWWEEFPTKEEELMQKYVRIWEQICENFGDFGLEVMFEALNEEGCWDSLWNRHGGVVHEGKQKAYELLGRINQKFIDVVRASGGNNAKRHLLIAGYATDIINTCDELFVLPEDPMNRYALSVHYYTPATFALIEEDVSWGKARKEWGTEADYAELNSLMDLMEEYYVKKGIPVIVGEYGCAQGNKLPDQVRNYITSVCEAIYSRGMCPVLWDTTGSFYDRTDCKFIDEVLLAEMQDIEANTERKYLAY